MRRSTLQQSQPKPPQPSNKQIGGTKRNILNNAAYSIFTSNETRNAGPNGTTTTSRRVNYSSTRESDSSGGISSFLQRSVSADNVVVKQRGFKPSDRHDPAKRNFLENLTSKILHFDMESGNTTPINLQKLLTPASDSTEMLHVKNKKMYASSYFYSPSHPTVEDQVELARRISNSLSDIKNVKSKGQSMYVNRKKRSVKWIHDGNGAEEEEEPSSPKHKDKVPLKCVMNPSGRVLDIHGIQALGEEVNIQTMPEHPEKLFDIVRDLNNQKGRGAEIFAKRRKRSEKWVVDTEQPQSPSNYNFGKAPTYPTKPESGANENSKFESKPFYNPFADLSMDYSTPPVTSCAYQHQHQQCNFNSGHSDCSPCHTEVKKIYLREIAVGTEPEIVNSSKMPDKSPRRSSLDAGSRGRSNGTSNGHARPSRKQSNGHHYQSNNYQPYPSKSNGYHSHQNYGFSYHNGHNLQHSQSLSNDNSYYSQQNGNGYHQNSNGHYQNGNGYHQNDNGFQQQQQQQQQSNGNEDVEENPNAEDYTPVPVKQLIQEFEKTCRPVMQYKQYSPKVVMLENNNQNDISRFFESRREVMYHNRRGSNDDRYHHHHNHHHHPQLSAHNSQQQRSSHHQYRSNNNFASSADEENDDEDEDDESLDDSLSPVEFYRIDDRRLFGQTNNVNGNRSSSMSTLDEYCRRQLQQCPLPDTIEDEKKSGDDQVDESRLLSICPAKTDGPGLEVSEEVILTTKKQLKTTTVLENLVAGTTTPECFKKEYTEEVAGKLYDGTYHGPKINSYQNLKNYNTAPRGWDGSRPVYKPVKFEEPQDHKIVYSDF